MKNKLTGIFAVLLACFIFKPAVSIAQSGGNNFCYFYNNMSSCFSTHEAAEADMRSKLPASCQNVIQPKTPRPAGSQPNVQGLEQWRTDYFIPDQPPEQIFPAGYSNGSAGAPLQCTSASDPFIAHLCSSENGAAYGLLNAFKATFPQCTFTDLGYRNSFVSPFSTIYESPNNNRYGVARTYLKIA